jgi:hypothetical protein
MGWAAALPALWESRPPLPGVDKNLDPAAGWL